MSVRSPWYRDLEALEREVRQSAGAPPLTGYVIESCLHRGGQGVVYAARSLETNQAVAIKLLRDRTIATLRARQRFDREIDLVSHLRHPGIVGVLDHGLSEDGEPYLVMERIDGVPIHHFIDRCCRGADGRWRLTNATRDEILRLVIGVCEAIQHAHQRGIIHRDLKTSNVLVDADGAPRVLDFGLARRAGDENPITLTNEAIMGSIAWMSPEHVGGDASAIDARSDVYAIGLLLYRLLAGRMPYDVDTSIARTLRHIERTEPASFADPAIISPDLDAVVRRCLRKDPDERYQAVSELARELQCILDDVPIEAERHRAWTRARRSLRRYRVALGVGVIAVIVLGGFALTLALLLHETSEARALAQGREEAARRAAERAETSNLVLENLLASVGNANTLSASLLDRLERAASIPSDDPALRARLALALGDAHLTLGNLKPAERRFRAAVDDARIAFGADHPELAPPLLGLAETLARQASPGAVDAHASSLRLRERLFDLKFPDLRVRLRDPAYSERIWRGGREQWAEALAAADRAVAINENADGDRAREHARALVTRATLDMWRGEAAEALAGFDVAIAMFTSAGATRDPAYVDAIRFAGHLHSLLDHLTEAERYYRQALLIGPETHGVWVRPELLWELGWIRFRAGDAGGAVDGYRQSLASICRLVAAERHGDDAFERMAQRLEDASFSNYPPLLDILSTVPNYAPDGVSWYRLGMALNAAGDPVAAEQVLRTSIDAIRTELGPGHPWTGRATGALGVAIAASGRVDDGRSLVERSYAHARRHAGPRSHCCGLALHRMARVLEMAGNPERSRAIRTALDSSGRVPLLEEIFPD